MKNWRFIGSDCINFISADQIEICSEEMKADVICILPESEIRVPTLLQVLLNERYASFGFWLTEEDYCQVGGYNFRLKQGRQYELLIRLAENRKIACITDERVQEVWGAVSDFYTDAYVLSRYADILRENDYFDSFLEACVHHAVQSKDEETVRYLEDMLGKGKMYWEIYQMTQPFLILMGGDFCYNILNDMAQKLACGLMRCGKSIEICDLSADKEQKLLQVLGKHYQAVIGFQSFLSNVYLKDQDCYLTDLIYGPKLELIFDHPFWFYKQLENHGADFYIMTHDENYIRFVREYEPSVSGSFLLPPGGMEKKCDDAARNLDIVFLGTYNNYRDIVNNLYISNREIRHMAACYLKYLRKGINRPAEWAFLQMLKEYEIEMEGEPFARMMYQMGNVCQCIMYYYREKIIGTLLDAGLTLHVYGASWKNSPFFGMDSLICHEEVAAENSPALLQRVKISLNILAWHKGGCNERIVNSMLAGAVVVTDKSSYIEKHFADGIELCCYDLQELEKLPGLMKSLLNREDYRQQIAETGRKKVQKEYNVTAQAERVVAVVEQINSGAPSAALR